MYISFNNIFQQKQNKYNQNFGANYIKPVTKIIPKIEDISWYNKPVTNMSNITIGHFVKIFYDRTLSVNQKADNLGIPVRKFHKWARKLSLSTERIAAIRRLKTMTKEQFLEVYNLDIPAAQKPKLLGISLYSYRIKCEEYGLKSPRQKANSRISSIEPIRYKNVFNKEDLSEAEKHDALNIGQGTYRREAGKQGLKTKRMATDAHIRSITKEVFDNVYFDKTLTKRRDKCKKLGISASIYDRLRIKYGYQSKLEKSLEHVRSITKTKYDPVFYNDSMNLKEKCEALRVTRLTYITLGIKFGHADEMNIKLKVPKLEFDRVYKDKNLKQPEKCKKLNLSPSEYYMHLLLYGYKTDLQKATERHNNVTDEYFLSIAKDPTLSIAEKCKILGYTNKTSYTNRARKLGVVTEMKKAMQRRYKFTKDDFDWVFFNKKLTEEEKHQALNLSAYQYITEANDRGYMTEGQITNTKTLRISKKAFLSVENNPNLTQKQKAKMLNVSLPTYRLLRAKYKGE